MPPKKRSSSEPKPPRAAKPAAAPKRTPKAKPEKLPSTEPAAPRKRAPRRRQPAAPSAERRAPSAERRAPNAERRTAAGDALHILMIASEAHPFAKTGGLAEVTGALPLALARLGHTVTLVVPRYRGVPIAASGEGSARSGPAAAEPTTVTLGGRTQAVAFHRQPLADRVTAVLVDAPELFDRDALYGTADADYPDNAWRFAVFNRAALEYARTTGERPSIVHAHDWQTGTVAAYQKMHLSDDPIVGGVPAVFTIHNLAFQGLFPRETLDAIGLGWEVYHPHAMEYWGQISYLKAGINFSESITTVSPTYAREILTREMGFGFEGVLTRRADDLVGILNGIDTERWNPQRDEFVDARFDAGDLSGKARAKAQLLDAVGLPRDLNLPRPVIGLVSRLTDQKGFDLIAAAAGELMELDAAWVMLGSGERRYEELWMRLAQRYPDRVSAMIGFDERRAHLIEAGADAFLMPSRFEPCGLNQMYSLRYGTVPIVRATGGLEDTVEDYDPATGTGTGFKFRDYLPGALVTAVRRALGVFPDRAAWARMQQAGMRQDPSWDASAREYVKVYRRLQRG